MNEKHIQKQLFFLADETYKSFQQKLMPSVDLNTVIGIRTPDLRRFAKEFAKTKEAVDFMKILPHDYCEENNLHAFLIESITDFDRIIEELNRFLPYVDNWATCDMMSPKIFSVNKEKLLPIIEGWLSSPYTYMVRYGIVMLMKHYLDDTFSPQYLKMVSEISSNEYYIEMAQAWYFAEALVKQYDQALPYLQNGLLSPFVHNKTISKACDSFRIENDKKNFLKTLRRKNSK
jgi:3-methyladenine DNA glycosylase AlkD